MTIHLIKITLMRKKLQSTLSFKAFHSHRGQAYFFSLAGVNINSEYNITNIILT